MPGAGLADTALAISTCCSVWPPQTRWQLICRAASAGITHLVGETLASNARMIALARRAGFSVRRSLEVGGVLLLQKTLEPWRPLLPGTVPRLVTAVAA